MRYQTEWPGHSVGWKRVFLYYAIFKALAFFWSDLPAIVFNLGMLVHPPGNDKEIDSDLLPAALEGEPLVEVR